MRSGKASAKVPQSTLDARGREARRWRDELRAKVGRILSDPHLTADTRSDFAWFWEELAPARIPIERLTQLDTEISACPVERKGWLRRALEPADYDDQDDGEIVDAELVDDDEPGQVTEPARMTEPGRRTLATAAMPAAEREAREAAERYFERNRQMFRQRDARLRAASRERTAR